MARQKVPQRSWKRAGWTEEDWEALEVQSATLFALARQLEERIGGGGGGLGPAEVASIAKSMRFALKNLGATLAQYHE